MNQLLFGASGRTATVRLDAQECPCKVKLKEIIVLACVRTTIVSQQFGEDKHRMVSRTCPKPEIQDWHPTSKNYIMKYDCVVLCMSRSSGITLELASD